LKLNNLQLVDKEICQNVMQQIFEEIMIDERDKDINKKEDEEHDELNVNKDRGDENEDDNGNDENVIEDDNDNVINLTENVDSYLRRWNGVLHNQKVCLYNSLLTRGMH
jgi:hypothetical protein